MHNISVVVCTKNEGARIDDCLQSVLMNNPSEIIVVDGMSADDTAERARKYADKVIVSKAGSLCADRQVGIDNASCEFIAMIDADHRLEKGSLLALVNDLHELDLDMVQSQLRMYQVKGFWDKAEDEMWQLNHNHVGEKEMIGTAPAIYKKEIFQQVRFEPETTPTIDDTDFIYRLKRDTNFKIGVGRATVMQHHFSSFHDYYKKFMWYGYGDGEFCRKHPSRALSMIYHLAIRYSFIYPIKALVKGKLNASLFCCIQGLVRIAGLLKYFLFSGRSAT